MASTAVAICNLALGRVRGGSIGALDEGSPQAEECSRLYEDRRDTLMALYAWRFCKATKALALKTTATTFIPDEWLYMYDYPNDCLKVHYILPPEHGKNVITGTGIATPRIDYAAIPYEVSSGTDGKRILTDYEEAHISYVKKIEDVTMMDPLFTDALGWFLAIDLAIPLGGDSGKQYRKDAKEGFKEAIDQAVCASEGEAEDGQPRLPKDIQARHGATDRDYHYNDKFYRRY